MLADEWSCLSTHKYVWLLSGGQDFNALVWKGAKTSLAIVEGGAHFECQQFSEFHPLP